MPSILGDVVDPAAPPADPAAAPAAPVVPETYEFKAPEIDGKPVEVDAAALEALNPIAKQAGLTQEQYQAVAEHGAKIMSERFAALQQAGQQASVQAFTTMVTEWGTQTKADPEIGGEKFQATLVNVNKALDTFATPGMRQVLIDSGAGNHPEVVRFLSRIGALAGDPTSLSTGKPAGRQSANPEQQARNFYNQAGGNYPDLTA